MNRGPNHASQCSLHSKLWRYTFPAFPFVSTLLLPCFREPPPPTGEAVLNEKSVLEVKRDDTWKTLELPEKEP